MDVLEAAYAGGCSPVSVYLIATALHVPNDYGQQATRGVEIS
jgi:hypothetical protein